ncbi:hypothetical protein [Olivibacter oleidegradans]|uniref:TIR-like protein DUF1863 n=1 Tax=Olivibacter oleidegradans TaxID=760123 RepID=A0ABV6HMV2_9SPHI
MEKPIKVYISHQSRCDEKEINNLIQYLEKKGFVVTHGAATSEEFAQFIQEKDYYVCMMEKNTFKSKEVANEISFAAKKGKRIFGIFCPDITESINIPTALEDYATGITEWNPSKLEKGLRGEDIGFFNPDGTPRKPTRKADTVKC